MWHHQTRGSLLFEPRHGWMLMMIPLRLLLNCCCSVVVALQDRSTEEKKAEMSVTGKGFNHRWNKLANTEESAENPRSTQVKQFFLLIMYTSPMSSYSLFPRRSRRRVRPGSVQIPSPHVHYYIVCAIVSARLSLIPLKPSTTTADDADGDAWDAALRFSDRIWIKVKFIVFISLDSLQSSLELHKKCRRLLCGIIIPSQPAYGLDGGRDRLRHARNKEESKSFEKEFLSLHGNADNEEVYVACLCKGEGIWMARHWPKCIFHSTIHSPLRHQPKLINSGEGDLCLNPRFINSLYFPPNPSHSLYLVRVQL